MPEGKMRGPEYKWDPKQPEPRDEKKLNAPEEIKKEIKKEEIPAKKIKVAKKVGTAKTKKNDSRLARDNKSNKK